MTVPTLLTHPLPFRIRAVAGATLLALSWLAGPAFASIAVAPLPRQVDVTDTLTVTLLVFDDGQPTEEPAQLRASATAFPQPPVELTLMRQPDLPQVPGQPRKLSYAAALPASLRGEVRLALPDLDVAPMVVTLARRNEAAEPVAAAPSPQSVGTTRPADQAPQARVIDDNPAVLSRFSFHEPVYVATGLDSDDYTQLQFSFRFRLLEPDTPQSKALLDNLYIGYTQTMLMDIDAESYPMYDSSYRPSLYYALPDTGVSAGWLKRVAFAAGYEHESNGEDKLESRSVDLFFVKPTFYLGDPGDWHFTFSPKLYYYLQKGSNNGDVENYRGYGDYRFTFGHPQSLEIAATLRQGTEGYASGHAQVTYPLARFFPRTMGYLYLSYFEGWGETLIDYNRRSGTEFRIGYSLWR
ncbi:phospholipase A [Chitiniphilus purpureus]|uniref:Phospholipase A1 n=1 Tax=Chitiniphilus purpureus TaxID=2981137 RepID=A0ABY6DPM3_9NEIS|nr:phospholipase A [Chitiniphilus sp. CD1]UXY16173.1 phospholipase A [Chitiniphilus sp. CD1]